jgi:serine/threonine-protein kinase HipA
MDELLVYVGHMPAGKLTHAGQRFAFAYAPGYAGPPVFLGWKLAQTRREWDGFPPAFDGLLPEGVLLDQLLARHKLDRTDKWGQLKAVGLDLTGFVSVVPQSSRLQPFGKLVPGTQHRKRVAIAPAADALPYTASELAAYHGRHLLRMSLSGMQPKVAAVYSRKANRFKVVEANGSYILKPTPQAFPGAAENEALTMQLAHAAGIEVPLCGWLQALDETGVFWIERFDRWGPGNRHRLRCEDACQILEVPSAWKYLGTLETLARLVREHCGNPRLQLVRLFHRVLFCWITGNGDMHLKNWSWIERNGLIELAPAYDLLNTRLLLDDPEESALSLDSRKSGFDRALLVDYFGRTVCGLNERMLAKTLQQLATVDWPAHIQGSRLPAGECRQYERLVRDRLAVLMP